MASADSDQDPRFSSPLHTAAADGDLEAIDWLAGEPGALDRGGALEMTPLVTALIYSQWDTALRLVELGADVNRPSALGSTPLMTACINHSLPLVTRLVAAGANVNYQQMRGDQGHWTALLCAAEVDDPAIAQLLLESGADADQRNAEGETALDLAIRKGHAGVVAALTSAAIAHREAVGRGGTHAGTATQDKPSATVEDARELEAYLATLSPESRYQGVVAGLLNAGEAFLNTLRHMSELLGTEGQLQTEFHTAQVLWASWLLGRRLTDRADEAERRLLALEEVIGKAGARAGAIMPAVARAILALPKGHPRRNVAFALSTLASHLNALSPQQQSSEFVLGAIELLESAVEAVGAIPSETVVTLVERAEGAVKVLEASPYVDLDQQLKGGPIPSPENVPLAEVQRRLRQRLHSLAGDYFLAEALTARDGKKLELQHAAAIRCREQLQRCADLSDERERIDVDLKRGMLEEEDDQLLAAAMAYESVVARRATDLIARQHAGRLRLRLGEPASAAEMLGPTVAPRRAEYLSALDQAGIASSGQVFAAVTTMHAAALALLDRWNEALLVLDQAKSLRLRQGSRLRRSDAGQRLLAIEAALYNIDRGLAPPLEPDSPGGHTVDTEQGGVLRRSLFLEEYRQTCYGLPADFVPSPSVGDVAAVLSPDEGVVVIGTGFTGTMLALITAGDTLAPTATCVVPELDREHLFSLCAEWRAVLAAPEGYKPQDHARTLATLLPLLDAALGARIRALVGSRALSRLTIVPHLWLHAVPFWALPSLEPFAIVLAPSADQLLTARAHVPRIRKAVVVGDPTLDLPLSRIEARAVEQRAASRGVSVVRVEGRDANEHNVVAALGDAGLLHFGGHGRSDALTPSRSALILQAAGIAPGTDPIETARSAAPSWDLSPRDGRFANLGDGRRLYEIGYPKADAREAFLEQGDRETLWARYQGAKLVVLGELWRAGDISVARSLDDCAIVFLSACEVASGNLGSLYEQSIDEGGGISASLQLAGVPCIIASLWPVWDDLALVFVSLFYEEAARSSAFDVAAIVHQVGRRVRALTGEEAAAIVRGQRAWADNLLLQFHVDAVVARLARLDRPFADPIHWAAFFVTGACSFRWNDPAT